MKLFETKTKLIFIVEDDKIYAKMLINYINNNSKIKVELKWFQVGELAIDQMNLNPDIVILDYNLNGKYYDAANGFEIATKMKEHTKKTKFILLSSQTNIDVAMQTVKQDRFSYVIKNNEAFNTIIQLLD